MFSIIQIVMRIILEIYFFLLFAFANTSKCPESRKPHITSCVIFYNCINLPEGGYVWVPSKCADGLVFHPSLRLCVLPGDSWSCDDTIDHSSIDDQLLHTSELIDETKTSYDEVITDDMIYHPIDIFNNVNNSSNLGNVVMTIPYPLIKIDEKLNKSETQKINSDLLPITIKRFGNHMDFGQKNTPATLIKVEDKKDDKISILKLFFNKIFLFQHIVPSLKQQTFVFSPFINYSTIINDERIGDDMLNYFIKNYMFKKISEDIMSVNNTEIVMRINTSENVETNTVKSNLILNSEKNQIDIEKIDELHNILAIKGNLGHKEYITVEKYKSWTNGVNIEITEIIPCIRTQRLPNSTDCTRYYTCDPISAEIHEFVCPSNTAFNNQINLCDTQKYKRCKKNNNFMESEKIRNIEKKLEKTLFTNEFNDDKSSLENQLCENTGKFADKTSDKYYYLCYSSNNSGNIESFRMVCPNDLIFCQDKKICTTKRFCSNFD